MELSVGPLGVPDMTWERQTFLMKSCSILFELWVDNSSEELHLVSVNNGRDGGSNANVDYMYNIHS